jgi:hypothetical protein
MAVQMELAIQTATLQTIAANQTGQRVITDAMEQTVGHNAIH